MYINNIRPCNVLRNYIKNTPAAHIERGFQPFLCLRLFANFINIAPVTARPVALCLDTFMPGITLFNRAQNLQCCDQIGARPVVVRGTNRLTHTNKTDIEGVAQWTLSAS
jgi:hypothetical protein